MTRTQLQPTVHPIRNQDTHEAALTALSAALDKKALEPVLLHVVAICSYTEYILIVSGRSDRQIEAIANEIAARLADRGRQLFGIEGVQSGKWALLDYGDLVVHVFHHPVREHYDLESLWADAPRLDIPDRVEDEASSSP